MKNCLPYLAVVFTALFTALFVACSTPSTSRKFEVQNRFTVDVPAGGQELQAWFAIPDDREDLQDISNLTWDVQAPASLVYDLNEVRDGDGNRFLHLAASDAGGASLVIETSFELTRREAVSDPSPARTRALNAQERKAMGPCLGQDTHVVITPGIRADAERVVGAETNPVVQARLLYGWVLDHVQYWVKDPSRWKSSGVGSSVYTHEQCTGNCTDFHSLYTASARSIGLPTRMVYGSFFKGPLNGKSKDQSYHCWVEFWAPNLGWIPIDVAVADVFVDDFEISEATFSGVDLTVADGYHGPDQKMVDYYFGNLDDRRVTWHRGRDLQLSPPQAGGPVNALPKAYVELDGKPLAEKSGWTRLRTFTEK